MRKEKRKYVGLSIAQARESFGKIRANIDFLSVDSCYKAILFSSSVAGEGKSTVVANLAISLAASDKKVLVIDADLRHPSQHKLFNIANDIGVSDIISRKLNWHEYVCGTNMPGIQVLTSGRIPPNPAELLGSKRMGELINESKDEYDYILIDSSPILLVSDTITLSKNTDGIILVARYNFTTQPALSSTKEELKLANIQLIGIVLNDVKDESTSYYRYGYGKKYGDNMKNYYSKSSMKEHALCKI